MRASGYIFPRERSGVAAFTGSAFGRAGVIGLHPLSGLLVGGFAGYFLRREYDAAWLFWLLLVLGFIAGCLNARREYAALLREQGAGTEKKQGNANDRQNP